MPLVKAYGLRRMPDRRPRLIAVMFSVGGFRLARVTLVKPVRSAGVTYTFKWKRSDRVTTFGRCEVVPVGAVVEP